MCVCVMCAVCCDIACHVSCTCVYCVCMYMSQEVGSTLIGEDGLMIMTGAESVEWCQIHQTRGFQVFDAIPFAPFWPVLCVFNPVSVDSCLCVFTSVSVDSSLCVLSSVVQQSDRQ